MAFYLRLSFVVALLAGSLASRASHLLGVELTYTHIAQQQYKISFRLYRDCLNGQPQAIVEDDPLFYSVFDGQGHFVSSDQIAFTSLQSLPPATFGSCLHSNLTACYNTILFEKIITLPVNSSGYYITNGRCCLASAIANVVSPGDAGPTAFAFIPANITPLNSAPAFHAMAQLNTCVNEPISIDCSASDADADDLSYYLVPAKRAFTAFGNNPKPDMVPPYAPDFSYTFSLSGQQPLPGTLQMDATSGLLYGQCNTRGQYLVAVACVERRNGQVLDTVTRTFTLAVTDCHRDVDAVITRPAANAITDSILVSLCGGGRAVQFHNGSTGADHYRWTFGEPAWASDTSAAVEPQHIYADSGLYPITLIAYGANCNDTATGYVRISDDVAQADFDVSGRQCIYDTLQLTDRSTSSRSSIHQFIWASEGNTVYGNPAGFSFAAPGSHQLTHTVISDAGCVSTVTKSVSISQADIRTSDTAVLSGSVVNLTASGGVSYNWYAPGATPVYNPLRFQYVSGGYNSYTYYVIGTDAQGCRGVDTTHLVVTEKGYVFVPSGFTPNGDSRNDILRLQQSGYTFIEFRVYDRRSGEVFYTRDQQTGWDGSYKGHTLATGVYFWMARLKDAGGKVQVFKGDVTLVR